METFYLEWNRLHDLHCGRAAEETSSDPGLQSGQMVTDCRPLYGRDAKRMKHFTLHSDMNEQCASLDRAWFGDMWFPVQKLTDHVHSSATYDSIPDPADLDLDEGYSEPDLCFSRSQVRDPAYALGRPMIVTRSYAAQRRTVVRSDSEPGCRKGESQVLAQ